MAKYIAKRILISVLTLLLILFVLFLTLSLMPGSPFNDEKLNQKQKEALYRKYGLDKPFFVRFFKYVVAMVQGDLGDSYVINKNKPVAEMVAGPLGVSIKIGFLGMLLGSALGLLLGISAALHHNSFVDSFSSVVSILGISVPSYVFALLLVYFVGYRMNLIPVLYTSKNLVGSYIGPMIALAMSPMASVSRFTRTEMIDVLGSDYVLLVKAKGVKQKDLIARHALRNTLIPIITIMGPILVNLLTGSMVVEKVFGVPGIGTMMVTAIQSNDYNVVIACAFIYSLMYIVMMLIIDVLYGVIDPRIRVAKEN
ncbi:MAG: ABC transporter permease [Clostridia bacterium]|nr:ABC transporter permease [Clostridia bacterium]MBR3295488.1 ABC transporter permease [Clostridia bacterium]